MNLSEEKRLKGSWKIFDGHKCIAVLSNTRFDPPFYRYNIEWLIEVDSAVVGILGGKISDESRDLKIVSCVDGEIMNLDHFPSIIEDGMLIFRDLTPAPIGFLKRMLKRIIRKLRS